MAFLIPKRLRHLFIVRLPLFANKSWNKQNKKRTQHGLYFTFNILLKYFNILGYNFSCTRYETLLLTEKFFT